MVELAYHRKAEVEAGKRVREKERDEKHLYLSGSTPYFFHTLKNSRWDELAASISPTRTWQKRIRRLPLTVILIIHKETSILLKRKHMQKRIRYPHLQHRITQVFVRAYKLQISFLPADQAKMLEGSWAASMLLFLFSCQLHDTCINYIVWSWSIRGQTNGS